MKSYKSFYESYITESIRELYIRGPRWAEAFDHWQEQLDEWKDTNLLEYIEDHNEHILKKVIDETQLKIVGDDTIIYFTAFTRVSMKSGKNYGRPSVVGVEQALDSSIIQGYMINATDMEFIHAWWRRYRGGDDMASSYVYK